MYPPIDPIIVTLGPISLFWYTLFLVAGVLAAGYVVIQHMIVSSRRPWKDPQTSESAAAPQTFSDVLMLALFIGGIPVLFGSLLYYLGPLALRWYGLLMMLGVLAAAAIARRYVDRKGENGEHIWDMLLWVVIPGFIGARLYYVFVQSPRGAGGLERYLANPAEILQIWEGGIHIFGGLIAGSIALLLYLYLNKLPPLVYVDGIALGLPLGQAIARQANFINQELYGPPTTLPWGLRIDPQHRLPPYNNLDAYPESVRFQPLFLYESLWNIIGFALIFWVSRRFEQRLRPGDIALLYLFWYPFGRFFIEFLRTDSWFFPGTPFNVVHVLSFIAFTGAAITLYIRHRYRGSNRQGRWGA